MKEQLILSAKEQMKKSYSPYSGYQVGTALLCADGSVYYGTNIENASFTPTVCAERSAFFSAVSDGKREFCAIAIAGGRDGKIMPSTPCGVCRQVMSEFCTPEFKIYVAETDDKIKEYTLGELLPHAFNL